MRTLCPIPVQAEDLFLLQDVTLNRVIKHAGLMAFLSTVES